MNLAGTAAANTNTTKLNNLAASSTLVLNATVNVNLGLIETTQVGTSGHNSLTVNATAASTVNKLTVSGDNLVVFKNGGVATIVNEFVDATNTLTTLKVGAGAGATTLTQVTGTALTTVDTTAATGPVTMGAAASALANNSMAFTLVGGQNFTAFTSGNNDTFTQKAGAGVITLTASGTSNTIDLSLATGNGSTINANGAGDTIKLGTGNNTVTATGAGDTISIESGAGATTVTVGANAQVNIGTANTANTGDVIKVATTSTGAAADAAFAKTTITMASGVAATGNVIDYSGTADVFTLLGGSAASSQVNVATATSLADALNMAANFTMLTKAQGAADSTADLAANTARVDWFQYGGDTYVVAMVNNTAAAVQQTKLDSNDIVVKLTGLVDLTGSNFAAEQFTI
jgi:hypothetical protein